MSQTEEPSPIVPSDGVSAEIARELRAEFDRSFASPAHRPSGKARDFVLIAVSGTHFALPVVELRSLERAGDGINKPSAQSLSTFPGEPVAAEISSADLDSGLLWLPVPSRQPALLGIRAFDGRIVPVFALSLLLGTPTAQPPTYCALVSAGDELAGFAFDSLLRLVRTEPEQLFAAAAGAPPWQQATLSYADELYPVINLAALVESLDAPDLHPSNEANQAVQEENP